MAFFINAADGLRSIYEPVTSPEVLLAALEAVEDHTASISNPEVAQQAEKLRSLSRVEPVRSFRYDHGFDQLDGLVSVGRSLSQSNNRRALVWLTGYPGFIDYLPKYEVTVEQVRPSSGLIWVSSRADKMPGAANHAVAHTPRLASKVPDANLGHRAIVVAGEGSAWTDQGEGRSIARAEQVEHAAKDPKLRSVDANGPRSFDNTYETVLTFCGFVTLPSKE